MHIADPRHVPTTVFLYTLHPTRLGMLTEGPTEAEQALVARHWTYSQELLARGTVIFAGRTLMRDANSFATVVINAPSQDAARAIVEADPSVAEGLFRASLFPYQPMLMGAWPRDATTVPTPGTHPSAE